MKTTKKLSGYAFRFSLFLAVLPFVAGGPAVAKEKAVTFSKQAADIMIRKPALYPETIEAGATAGHFLLSSFREGAIYDVDLLGNTQILVKDERLRSVLGIYADKKHNRLYATNSDIGASVKSKPDEKSHIAGLGIYDLRKGTLLKYVDIAHLLPGSPHLLNGITGDGEGNIYITDSFSPVIYKVDAEGKPSVFLQSEKFVGEGINLNGIQYHPDGYLLVIKKSSGVLYRVPVDHPEAFAPVKLGNTYIGGDGVTLIGKDTVLLVANQAAGVSSNSAFVLKTTDNWKTATQQGVYHLGDVYPTTGIVQDDSVYVLHSRLNRLIRSARAEQNQLQEDAVISRIGRIE